MKQIFTELRKAVLYQHKSLTKAVYTCNADKFILQINRLNTRTILSHISILENRFIFKKRKYLKFKVHSGEGVKYEKSNNKRNH